MRPVTAAPFDPRALLVLTALYGLLIWKTGPAGLMVCAAAFAVFALFAGRPPVPAGGFARACGVALFWGFLKLAGDAFTIGPAELLGRLPGLLPQAGILSLRLFLLLTLGLGLTALVSPPALGGALIRLMPPAMRRRCWRVGPALAFMARCLPEIFFAARETRAAARARGLPEKGPAFWRLALPQIFRLPALRLHALATAAAMRGLDAPEAWITPRVYRPSSIPAFFCLAGFGILVLF